VILELKIASIATMARCHHGDRSNLKNALLSGNSGLHTVGGM